MTEEELAAIDARAQAATREPWTIARMSRAWDAVVDLPPMLGTRYGSTVEIPGPRALQDAVFIAHARTDIPALLAEVRRLRALVADQDPDRLTFDLVNPICTPDDPNAHEWRYPLWLQDGSIVYECALCGAKEVFGPDEVGVPEEPRHD